MSVVVEPQTKPRSRLVRAVKVLALLAAVAAVAFVGIGVLVLDGKYDVSREVVVKAPPAAVHKNVGDLREWPKWLPFTKQDPSVKTIIDQPTGVGAHQTWTGNYGSGELTFTASDEAKGAEFAMLFDGTCASHGAILYAPAGDGTRVTWRMTGQNTDFVGKWLALAMPVMVGPMFDEGLADLKKLAETR